MGKRLTPIERAIAGTPADRRRRYEEKMKAEGFTRINAFVRQEDYELLRAVAAALREHPDEVAAELRRIARASGEGAERPQRSEDAPHPSSAPGRAL